MPLPSFVPKPDPRMIQLALMIRQAGITSMRRGMATALQTAQLKAGRQAVPGNAFVNRFQIKEAERRAKEAEPGFFGSGGGGATGSLIGTGIGALVGGPAGAAIGGSIGGAVGGGVDAAVRPSPHNFQNVTSNVSRFGDALLDNEQVGVWGGQLPPSRAAIELLRPPESFGAFNLAP